LCVPLNNFLFYSNPIIQSHATKPIDLHINLSAISTANTNQYFEEILNLEGINQLKFLDQPSYKFEFASLSKVSIIDSKRHEVFKYYHKDANIIMAIKFVPIPSYKPNDKENETAFKRLREEIGNLKPLKEHPNIIDLFGIGIHEGKALFCMELMDFALNQFYTWFYKRNDSFSEEMIAYIAVSVLNALQVIFLRGYFFKLLFSFVNLKE
jgi:serine/threonine protein kinase